MTVHFDRRPSALTRRTAATGQCTFTAVQFELNLRRKVCTTNDLSLVPTKNAIKIKIFISAKLLINRTFFCHRCFKYSIPSIYSPVIPGLSFVFDVSMEITYSNLLR